ncbi:MAG: alpha-galactosidase [Anaerolineales bacterium]|nr:alpha-galactosidase [Anaerolineales bacterium]
MIKNVNALGMDFGLWVEPEMVNPDSDLYRAHPDWVIYFPSAPVREARRQLILNLGRTDVQEYIISVLTTILSENNIQSIKWDMNRNVSEPGWSDAPGDARELWVRYAARVCTMCGVHCVSVFRMSSGRVVRWRRTRGFWHPAFCRPDLDF